jgi:hypothetical protein
MAARYLHAPPGRRSAHPEVALEPPAPESRVAEDRRHVRVAREAPETIGRMVHQVPGAKARVARIQVGEGHNVSRAEEAAVLLGRVERCACHGPGERATGVPAPAVWRAVRQTGWRDGVLPGASPLRRRRRIRS